MLALQELCFSLPICELTSGFGPIPDSPILGLSRARMPFRVRPGFQHLKYRGSAQIAPSVAYGIVYSDCPSEPTCMIFGCIRFI